MKPLVHTFNVLPRYVQVLSLRVLAVVNSDKTIPTAEAIDRKRLVVNDGEACAIATHATVNNRVTVFFIIMVL